MNFRRNAKGLIILYMFGFFVGNIYANLFVKDYIASIGIFSEHFLDQYVLTEIDAKRYSLYLIRLRIFPAITLCAAAFTRARKATAFLFLVWTGFLCGIVVTAAIMKMGILGSVFVFLSAFPQMIFYFCAYMLLLWNICRYPMKRQNYTLFIVVLALICAGIVAECYINPLIVKMFLKTV